jgi:6-pyruvoyltetrahydropterin/6-carboxytetrahydropterin synthase
MDSRGLHSPGTGFFLIDFFSDMPYYPRPMYELMVESKFAAAHQLRGYKGKCEKLHGHNWRVTVAVTAERLDDIGLAIDFHELKKSLRDVLDQLEHTFLNEIFPFTQINPSSENVAKWIYDNMAKKIDNDTIEVASVTVWESDTASASYFE